MKYEININAFADETALASRLMNKEIAGTSKFSIKVRKADLRLIDRLAQLSGRSRANIINALVTAILNRMLRAMRDDDEDFAALLALHVDEKCGKNVDSTDGWSAKLFGLESYYAKSYWMQHEEKSYEPSEKYNELHRRIKENKK